LDISENLLNLPGGEILFARLASNLLQSGDVEEAIKLCENGLKKFPTYAQAHFILAKCYLKQQMNDEARAELERVLRYDPNHLNAIKDLSSLYFLNGFQDLYKEYLFKLFTLDPINEEVIDEVRKLGEYELWSPVSPVQPPEEIVDEGGSEPAESGIYPSEPSELSDDYDSESPSMDEIGDQEILESSIEEREEREESSTDSIFPDRIDLSQFDNLDDDFTTILHGKLEYPDTKPRDLQDNPELQKAKEAIFGGEEPIVDKAPTEEIVDTMDELLGEDEEIGAQDLEKIINSEENQETESTIPVDSKSISQKNIPPISTLDEIPADQSPKLGITDPAMMRPEMNDSILSSREESEVVAEREEETTIPFSIDSDQMPEEEEEKFEQPRIISQTLGEILVSQKKYAEAKSVFEALREKQPQNKSLDVKIAYLDQIIGLEKVGKSKTIAQ
jgi:tetratricopeptide (TPR) repeat protein